MPEFYKRIQQMQRRSYGVNCVTEKWKELNDRDANLVDHKINTIRFLNEEVLFSIDSVPDRIRITIIELRKAKIKSKQ